MSDHDLREINKTFAQPPEEIEMTKRNDKSQASNNIEVQVRRLPHAADLPLPTYQSEHAAGLDLCAAVPADRPVVFAPGAHATIPTGFTIALPAGTEGQVRPRSGLAARHGVTVLNAPGTIDADYRGEVAVVLINYSAAPFTLERGARIAQLVIAPVLHASISEAEHLDETDRSAGGFGSTGG
jgi:dUTP pyrophosphatase